MIMIRALLIVFLVLPTIARAGEADPILEAVVKEAQAASPLDHQLIRTYSDNSGKTRQRKARFDPLLPEDQRWTLLERNNEPPSDKYLRRFDRDEDREPPESYRMAARILSGPVRLIGVGSHSRTYAVEPLGAGSIEIDGYDISENISGVAVIDISGDRPLLTEITLSVTNDFRPRWFAKISEGEGKIRFGRDDAGHPVILDQTLRVKGSQPFGSIDYAVSMVFSEHRFVGGGD